MTHHIIWQVHIWETCCLIFMQSSAVKMGTMDSSRALATLYQTTWCHKPEDCKSSIHHSKNHKSHMYQNSSTTNKNHLSVHCTHLSNSLSHTFKEMVKWNYIYTSRKIGSDLQSISKIRLLVRFRQGKGKMVQPVKNTSAKTVILLNIFTPEWLTRQRLLLPLGMSTRQSIWGT